MVAAPFPDLKLFITGPTYLRPAVRAAGAWPEFGHRDAENAKRFRPIFEDLAVIAGLPEDYRTMLLLGSGSTAMEAAIRSLAGTGETVLHVTVGAFGDLWYKMSLANDKKAVSLAFEPGAAVDPDRLEAALDAYKPAVVAVTHNETSTGVVNDVADLCRRIKARGALALVDGVSIFGGAPTHIAAGCDMYCTATQKSLGLHAGFGIGFVSPEAVEKARHVTGKGHAGDILKHLERAAKFQTQSTPNGALGNQMFVQLEYIVKQEGLSARFARHEAMRDQALAFVAGLPGGFAPFAPEGFRSPTTTAVVVPQGMTFADLKAVKEGMRARGYLFDPGYAKLNEDLEAKGRRPIFRIGHMGDITPEMLAGYLEALGQELAR